MERTSAGLNAMKRTIIALVVLVLAVAGANSATAQDPCQPSCDVDTSDWDVPGVAGTAPAFLAMTVLLVAPRLRAGGDGVG